MKRFTLLSLSLFAATVGFAQAVSVSLPGAAAAAPAAAPETFIKGDASIKFNTRTNTDSDGKVKEGVTDKYMLAINVSNSVLFRGTIEHTPYISKMVGSSQLAHLDYTIECSVVNPKNP